MSKLSKKNLPNIKTAETVTDAIYELQLIHTTDNAVCDCDYFKHVLKLLKDEMLSVMDKKRVEEILDDLSDNICEIWKLLLLDAKAGHDGDPAATSVEEVIVAYPFMKVMAVHRIAHFLYKKGVPLIPRLLSEVIHRETGIDIHPGATIGKSFFIDHGTGTVIGETTIIGNNVKIYQGVTLGAYSFPKNACGELIRGNKRHPTIADNVIIYANASILGNIEVGKNSIIGSNVWINKDVDDNTMVLLKTPEIITHRI